MLYTQCCLWHCIKASAILFIALHQYLYNVVYDTDYVMLFTTFDQYLYDIFTLLHHCLLAMMHRCWCCLRDFIRVFMIPYDIARKSPVAQWVKGWPTDLADPSSNLTRDKILSMVNGSLHTASHPSVHLHWRNGYRMLFTIFD